MMELRNKAITCHVSLPDSVVFAVEVDRNAKGLDVLAKVNKLPTVIVIIINSQIYSMSLFMRLESFYALSKSEIYIYALIVDILTD